MEAYGRGATTVISSRTSEVVINYIDIVDSIVGWVEVTKPNKPRKLVLGLPYRSTQPTNFYNIILSVAFFFRF